MLAGYFAPEYAPFAIALMLMVLIGMFELIGFVVGASPSALLDSLLPDVDLDLEVDLDVDLSASALDIDAPVMPDAAAPGPLGQVLGWLSVGKVPVLVLLVIFLIGFGLAGYVIQSMVVGIIGAPLPAALAAVPAFLAALPLTRHAGRGLARIVPKEESDAVSQESFIGKVATIVRGKAAAGLPAEAKLRDSSGQAHYLLVEPDDDGESFVAGVDVLVVRRAANAYRVIANTNPEMRD